MEIVFIWFSWLPSSGLLLTKAVRLIQVQGHHIIIDIRVLATTKSLCNPIPVPMFPMFVLNNVCPEEQSSWPRFLLGLLGEESIEVSCLLLPAYFVPFVFWWSRGMIRKILRVDVWEGRRPQELEKMPLRSASCLLQRAVCGLAFWTWVRLSAVFWLLLRTPIVTFETWSTLTPRSFHQLFSPGAPA